MLPRVETERREFVTWVLAFGILFLAEVHRAEPSEELRARIQSAVETLEAGRVDERGGGHNLVHSYYGPFVGVTSWCVTALTAAREQGVKVDEEGLAEALRGLRLSVCDSGGAIYRQRRPRGGPDREITRVGVNWVSAGRTGGVLWALSRCDPEAAEEIDRARRFLREHLSLAPHGHASRFMNFAWGALGAASMGRSLEEAFWKVHRRTVLKAPGKSFVFFPKEWSDLAAADHGNGETSATQEITEIWADRLYGPGWATAFR